MESLERKIQSLVIVTTVLFCAFQILLQTLCSPFANAAIMGDINADGLVDISDLQMMSQTWGLTESNNKFNPAADLNHDGLIDISDYNLLNASIKNQPSFLTSLPGDVNGDGLINISDVTAAANAFGRKTNDSGFNPRADINHDGIINGQDITAIGSLMNSAPKVPGDVNGDGIVNGMDLALISAAWGTSDSQADLNKDGVVDISDITIVAANWLRTSTPKNTPPVFQSIVDRPAVDDELIVIPLSATDIDKDPITYSIEKGPANAAIVKDFRGDSFFEWTPTDLDLKTHLITLKASDKTSSASVSFTIPVTSQHAFHTDDMAKHEEHAKLLELVPYAAATHIAVRSGPWSAVNTWKNGFVPGAGSKVFIQRNLTVTVDQILSNAPDWIRVDGTLNFATNQNTELKVKTIVVNAIGSIEIGTENARIQSNKTARILFMDRGPRDRAYDPIDIGGGLVAHGKVNMYGAAYTSHMIPIQLLTKGLSQVSFSTKPNEWKAGDKLIIAGVNPFKNEDEQMTIQTVSADGRTVTLDRALAYDHLAPQGMKLVPIGNLTRNIILESENKTDLTRRGHFMVMHTQTGIVIDGAGFYGMGRTDVFKVHTTPKFDANGNLIAGTDANTIGRYAVHFHGRTGASVLNTPNIFRNSAIVDSPKHGVVNHGGNVIAEHNVTFNIKGSHFFSENGTEIGAFRDNLAVRSYGSGEGEFDGTFNRPRAQALDFGHTGHGFWMQSGGVEVTDNFAFGHTDNAYMFMTFPLVENGVGVSFLAANLKNPAAAEGQATMDPANVPYYFARNVAAGSKSGIKGGYNKRFAKHKVFSIMEDCVVWGMETDAASIPYSQGVIARNMKLFGDLSKPRGVAFNRNDNQFSTDFIFQNIYAEGFEYGIKLPLRGNNVLENSYLNNKYNVWLQNSVSINPTNEERRTDMKNLSFGTLSSSALKGETQYNIYMTPCIVSQDTTMIHMFGNDVVTLDGKQLYFPEQTAGFILFNNVGIPELDGKTAQQIWDEYHLAIGGALAPVDAVPLTKGRGFVGSSTNRYPLFHSSNTIYPAQLQGYLPFVWDYTEPNNPQRVTGISVNLKPAWNFVQIIIRGIKRTIIVYAGGTLPPGGIL